MGGRVKSRGASLRSRGDTAQLRHDMLRKEPHRLADLRTGNPAAPIELQDALIHQGKLLLEAWRMRSVRCAAAMATIRGLDIGRVGKKTDSANQALSNPSCSPSTISSIVSQCRRVTADSSEPGVCQNKPNLIMVRPPCPSPRGGAQATGAANRHRHGDVVRDAWRQSEGLTPALRMFMLPRTSLSRRRV
jgi:hypothetical protein